VIYNALLDVFPMIVVLYLLKELVACREELEANENGGTSITSSTPKAPPLLQE
jgi:hypothetical protein